MKRACFGLVVIMVLLLGLTSIASAYTPTLPPQASAWQHSHIFMPANNIDQGPEMGTMGIIIPPCEL